MASDYPDTHERLRPRVVRYPREQSGADVPIVAWALRVGQLLISLLLVVICVNVAILVYARTVVRGGEMAVRSALGVSRRRIVAQLFVEAFALSAIAAVIGLVPARIALGRMEPWMASVGSVPYWFDLELSVGTAIYVLALAVLAAVIVGVLPALKATGTRLQTGLRDLSGGTRSRLGRTWTVLIVAQVAIAVAVVAPTVMVVLEFARPAVSGPGFPAEEVLTALVISEPEAPVDRRGAGDEGALQARRSATQAELATRLEAEPGISAVTFSSGLPGREGLGGGRIEVDGIPAQETRQVRSLRMDPGLFEAYDAEILAGRGFDSGDRGGEAASVIVNRTFERRFFANGNVLGRRLRYVPTRYRQPESWQQGKLFEIVGVVSDFPAFAGNSASEEARAIVYHPLAPGELPGVMLSMRLEGAVSGALVGRIREIAAEVDPTLQMLDVLPLTEVYDQARFTTRLLAAASGFLTLSALLLSAAGIYALLSFTVAQRMREIGIRSAMGGHPRRILGDIFARVLRQLTLGLAVGSLLSGGVLAALGLSVGRAVTLLFAAWAIMLAAGLLAALGPARRGLSIQPREALRADA